MRNTNNTYKTQGGDNLVINVKENAPLLEYLINNVSESRSKLKATLQGRGIAVNGRMVTQFDYQLKAGDKITISRHKKQNQFKSRYVKIVYEDRWLVVVEKNIGILSMAAGHSSLNVKSVLDDYFAKSHQKCRAHVVHRLDRDTSGLMVVARTLEAYHSLQQQFACRTAAKRYEAVLDGIPTTSEGTISLPLMPDITDRPRQRVDMEHGKPSVTTYRVVSTQNHRTLVWLFPHTGRTHQLRVHCAHPLGLATPILGDPLYGRGTAAAWMK